MDTRREKANIMNRVTFAMIIVLMTSPVIAETVKQKTMTVKCENLKEFNALPVSTFSIANPAYSDKEHKVSFTVNSFASDKPCWRLVHDGVRVIALFESSGITETVYTLFVGTREECMKEVERLKLYCEPEGGNL